VEKKSFGLLQQQMVGLSFVSRHVLLCVWSFLVATSKKKIKRKRKKEIKKK